MKTNRGLRKLQKNIVVNIKGQKVECGVVKIYDNTDTLPDVDLSAEGFSDS